MSATYEEMTARNAGFLTARDQAVLRTSSVFVCGVGGMGGAAAHVLARAGVGRLTLADPDCFEASNLNRQTFAFADTLGVPKAEATRDALRRINAELTVEVLGGEWVEELDRILPGHRVVVNGMDDMRAGIRLYRGARQHGATVVDAYTSPHPSVALVRPGDPRPEERLGFPTVGVPTEDLTEEQLRASFLIEVLYASRVSNGVSRLAPDVVEEILAGRRPRSSFAPTVILAGSLMAFEAIGCLLGWESGAGCEGYFVDPWSGRIERPHGHAARPSASAVLASVQGGVP
jgi:hypothetical protein